MNHSEKLKKKLSKKAVKYCIDNSFTGVLKKSAFLFDDIGFNFYPKSYYSKVCIDNKKRLDKVHSQAEDYKEMQSSNSSDVLLMNIFCHPDILKWKGVTDLLGVNKNDEIEFGWNPQFKNEKDGHNTEIDMRIGNIIFEAKLTEKDFTAKEFDNVKNYPNNNCINLEKLKDIKGNITNYQLIRNLLVLKWCTDVEKFFLLIDESRTDLIREFYKVKSTIQCDNLTDKFRFLTWQEIGNKVGADLKTFLDVKYF